ncbi:MAG: phosphate acetyltransferase [Candidatus Margulisiibacteriota bacterium]
MDEFIKNFRKKAAGKQKTIVLPESSDTRVLQAAAQIIKQKIAGVILVGDPAQIDKAAKSLKINLKKAIIIDPKTYPDFKKMANDLYTRRQKKGMTLEQAEAVLSADPLFFGAMLVASGYADGMVAGADNPTSSTIKASIHCVGTAPGTSILSSFFIMLLKNKEFGRNGVLFFADCAVNPMPDSQQLSEIAISTADSYKSLMPVRSPRVALLSFSTKGSAKHESVEKVAEALKIIQKKEPKLIVDGEMQFDAAVVPAIGKTKAKGSKVAGYADVLIFPDLNAGNIGYKITERIGNALAVGPIFQGLKKPINDLSRGCSVDDIVNVTAITVLQCK